MDNSLLLLLQEWVKTAEKKLPYAAATFFDKRGLNIEIDCKDERMSAVPSDRGVVFTLFDGEKFREYCTDRTENDALAEFSRNAIERTSPGPRKYEITVSTEKKHAEFRTIEEKDPDRIGLIDKLDICRACREKMRRGNRVINASAGYHETFNTKYFVNRSNVITEAIRRISHSLIVYVSDGREIKSNFLINGGTCGLELIDIRDSAIEEMVATANELLGAKPIEPGFYDVVITPEIAGLVAHEAFGHGVETDMYLKDRARSRDYLGEVVASELASIIDGPSLPGAYGSYFIDDEGERAKPTIIVKDGKFVQGLTDNYSSSVLNIPRTPNGRRASYERKVYARMSNTFFKPGAASKEEMIASIDNGVYLVKGMSGMEDPKGWGIQIIVLYGREIKNGRITNRVYSPLGITGFVPDLLKSISMVGNDFSTDSGSCGKGYKEYLPVSSGGPHIKARMRLG